MNFSLSKEIKVVLPRFLLMLFLYIIYCIIRDLRESVILSSNASGAEVIPFLKLWAMLPAAIFFTALFSKLSNRFGTEVSTYLICSAYLAYFIIFAFWIFPQLEQFILSDLSVTLKKSLPSGFYGFVDMICNWPLSIFYVLSGTWATIVVSLLYWGCINQISSPKEASSSYGILKIGGTLSAVLAGLLASFFQQSQYNPRLPFGKNAWEQTIMNETALVGLLGISSLFLFRLIYCSGNKTETIKKKKLSFSLTKSLSVLAQSRYLVCIAVLVFGFTFIYDLCDVLWKAQLKAALEDPNLIMQYLNKITMIIGTVSIVATLCSSMIIEKFGWKTLAIITPLTVLFSGFGFFVLLLASKTLDPYCMSFFGMSSVALSIFMGALQSCLGRAAKYSVFDVSKEIAFTPLDSEESWNGKTAIDGIGNDVARVSAASVHQVAIIAFGNIMFSAPAVVGIILMYLLLWIWAVDDAAKTFDHLTGKKTSPQILEEAKA